MDLSMLPWIMSHFMPTHDDYYCSILEQPVSAKKNLLKLD